LLYACIAHNTTIDWTGTCGQQQQLLGFFVYVFLGCFCFVLFELCFVLFRFIGKAESEWLDGAINALGREEMAQCMKTQCAVHARGKV
jgi:hypothetical protein